MRAAPDRLTDMLTRLKLTAVRDQLDSLLDEAGRQELSIARDALSLFCEREIARKDERRIEMTLKLGALPVRPRPGRLRLRGAALDRSQAGARARRRTLDRQWRERSAARAAWRGQDASRRGARTRSDRGRALRAVRRRRPRSWPNSPRGMAKAGSRSAWRTLPNRSS